MDPVQSYNLYPLSGNAIHSPFFISSLLILYL